MRSSIAAVLVLVGLVGCKSVPVNSPSALEALKSPGAFLSGRPIALGPQRVLNREDFVYDAKLSPDAQTVALSRLGMKTFHLALHDLRAEKPSTPRWDPALNPLEFDVDMLEFSPDGATVASVSRDGALRLHTVATGALSAAWLTEEPLVSVAWSLDGALLAVGSAKGLVTVLSFPALEHVAEVRAHSDEVRGLAFTPAGALVSAGWDRKLVTFSLTPSASPARVARTHVTKKNGVVSFRAVLDRAASATLALDARSPVLVIRPSLAQAVGIDVLALSDTISIPTALGNQLARVAHGRSLSVKSLRFEGIDVAVCEACVPVDVQGVLGGPVLDQVTTAFDETTTELVLTAKEGATVSGGGGQDLTQVRSFTMKAPINDLTLDAAGHIAGLAMSETKSERTKAIYDREKKGEVEPAREWDCGARVELATGTVLEQVHGHRGVVATAAISPDGKSLATGGWDKKVVLHAATEVVDDSFGWAVRRVRFSRDGRWLVIAAWTPQNPLNDHQSDPAGLVREVIYAP